MGIQDLFVAASLPVLKVLLLTALGSFLALDRVNILGEDARKHMNNVGFYVYNPALISSNLSKTITYDSLITWWFMPVNILITFIVGSVLGWIVILITRAPSHLKGLILGCCAAGNLGNMPLIIIPAVCKEKGSPFGDPDICYSNGMAYATLSMAVGAVFLWSYVFNIVRIYSTKTEDIKLNVSTKSVKLSEETSRLFPESCTEELLPSKDCSISEDQVSLPCSISYDKVEADREFMTTICYVQGWEDKEIVKLSSLTGKLYCMLQPTVIQHLKMLAEKVEWNRLFAPSTIGAIVGFVIGVVPQIRMLLIGESAPLRVIQDSTSLLSDGAIPTLTLIVGGNLTKGSKGSGVKMSLIFGITIVRYILLPLCGVLVVKGAVCFGLIHSDPLYQFVLMLQFTLPPAMNIGTMTQLFGAGESECSVIMLWTYTIASVALTLWSTYFMWLVS